ncbi:MAG: glycoside hydrolase family 3 C-terminal domain-containing protein [Roseburia sp.]|nr:glycoside hydrolase family 3 C-terminal domain-containing protein [Roseburia sp.]
MAALKYERFIVKMSTEQKVRLITSTVFFKSSSVGSYDFPVFEIKDQPFGENCKGVRATHFPCDAALASSWNGELVSDVYAAVGEEARAIDAFSYFNCSDDITAEKLTSDHYVLSRFLAEKISGLRRGGAYVNFENTDAEFADEQDLRRAVRDGVLNNAAPSSVVFSDITEAEAAVKRFKYGDLVYGIASTVDEALDFLYSGASFVFLSEDVTEALANKLTALVEAYKQAHTRFVNDKMTESNFARLVRNFRIFDGEILDRACDNVIDIVYSMQSLKDNPPAGYSSLVAGETAPFDEINHNALALTAARQSAVLLKNEGGLLPLNRGLKLAVMGEYAKDIKYQRGYYVTAATAEILPFDAVNKYELNTVGFALGYAKGERGRSDLIDHARLLCNDADCVILYLSAPKGADKLPAEQLELLNAIAGRHAKIAAVVSCEGNIDMSFADMCDAVLLTYVSGQGGTVAALDILTGVTSPSGKLASPAGTGVGETFTEKYPLGFGLSYTTFEYTNLSVNESGVSFTVRNTGGYDGFAVPRMYVRKKNTKSSFKNKTLKGFVKVYVKKGDAVRVKIPFDETTFSLYSPEKGYYVEGGLYTVSVGETDGTDKLSGIMMLKDYDEKYTFKNAVVETSSDVKAVDFSEPNLPPDVKAARKKLPFALRITLAIVLALYVDAIIIFFAVGNAISNKDLVFYIIIAAVALVVNGLVIAYVGIVSTQRKSQKYLHPNVVLTDMLDNVDEFTEIAKVKYKQPVEQAAEEEPEIGEEQAAAEQEAEALAATYEVKFDDTETSDAVLADKVSFGELSRNLRDFAMRRGVNLEITSARSFVAAVAACKLVFVTTKNAELLPAFVKILNEYYGNETPITADDGWNSLSDLLWEEGEGKFVLSAFSNAVYGAHKSREQERVVVIDNVNINNLGRYFGNFLEYANHPTEEYVINFNEETSFRLPDNLTYVLIAQDGVLDMLPTEILNASLVAEVMLSEAAATDDEEVEPKLVSHEDFLLMLSEAKEGYFVSERIWKKVDKLSETLNETERFAIGNKNIIQSESFTSVMLACGADEPEAVTNMFLAKLSYILKNTHAFRQEGGEKTVFAMVEKLFADEELTKIKRSLAKRVRVEEIKPEAPAETQAAAGHDGQAEQPAPAERSAEGVSEENTDTQTVEEIPQSLADGTGETGVAPAETGTPAETEAPEAGQPSADGNGEEDL